MAIPAKLIEILSSIPNQYVDGLLKKADHIIARNAMGKSGKDGLLFLLKNDHINTLKAIYQPLSVPLTAAGCVGGPVGFAVNIIDAIFCYVLSDGIGLAIDILSAFFMVPGVKGVLKIGAGASKILLGLIKENKQLCLSLKVFSKVVSKLKTISLNPMEFIPKLYDLYKYELKCSVKFQNEILSWIYKYYQKVFNAMENELKKMRANNVSSKSSISQHKIQNRGVSTAGHTAGEGQMKQHLDLSYDEKGTYYRNSPFGSLLMLGR